MVRFGEISTNFMGFYEFCGGSIYLPSFSSEIFQILYCKNIKIY